MLERRNAGFGIFEAAIAVGGLTGSLAVAGWAKRLPIGRTIIVGFALVGAGMAAIAAVDQVWIAAVVFGLVGIANAAGLISIDTYVQQVVPEQVRGRVWGSRFMLTQGGYAVSVLGGRGAGRRVRRPCAVRRRRPGRRGAGAARLLRACAARRVRGAPVRLTPARGG